MSTIWAMAFGAACAVVPSILALIWLTWQAQQKRTDRIIQDRDAKIRAQFDDIRRYHAQNFDKPPI